MLQRALTLGHSPDPDHAFMFYGLAKDLIPTHGFRFEHILQDIQTPNERATPGLPAFDQSAKTCPRPLARLNSA
jgi:1,4-dihydroxy-6-naphthoate synthase